ncbi:MAG: RND transporter [Rhodospirillaceae bacterium]|nr:RND transporter [Rhodospirillaceae bacterium]
MAQDADPEGWKRRYGGALIAYRWWILLASVLFTAFAVYGMSFLDVNPDSRVFFSKDNPQLIALEELENTYTKDDNVMFALAPKDGKVFTRETLAAIKELTQQAWQIPYSSRVDSITNFQHSRADEDSLIVSDLVEDPESMTDEDLARAREVALEQPELRNWLITDRSDVTGVNVQIYLPGESIHEVDEIAAFARTMAADFEAEHPDIAVYLTGGIMVNMAYSEAPEQDIQNLFPIMIGLMVLILIVALRSILSVLAILAVVLMSVIAALGLSGWAGVVMNAGTMGAPMIILTLSIANCVHVLVTMLQEMRKGTEKRAAIVESLRVNMTPIFITSVTTAIGFLTMNFSDAPPFRLLGNIVATGMIAAMVFSMTFLPALMAVLPLRVRARAGRRATAMEGFGNFVIRRRVPLLWVMAAVTVVLVAGIPRIYLDDDFIKYFDERFKFRTDTDFVTENLTAMNTLEFSVPAGEEGGISNPEYLKTLDEFTEWLRARDNVVNVMTLSTTIKRLNMNMHGDDPEYYRIPESRDLAAQYLLLYELSLPFGLDLNNRIDVSKSASRVTVMVHPASTSYLRQLNAEAEAWLNENASLKVHGTGLSLIFAFISERNINSMLGGSLLALVVISAILMGALRSFRIGLLSLVPNLFPAAMAFGLWGYLVGEVGLAIAVVVAMTLGIIVDDTVHFLSKYLRARREHALDPYSATRYAFGTVGMALVLTSLVLVVGFGVLSFSGFKVNGDMGLLSAITIAFALLADFLLLPPLLMVLEGRVIRLAKPAGSDVEDMAKA